jgi:exopolysaccharide production protein ExoZ
MTAQRDVKQEFYGIQVLRAIAALAVVAGHSTDYLVEQTGHVPRQLAWLHGPAGVDIFFVISGFVMMISAGGLLRHTHPARLFLLRRCIRIVPLYWLLTSVKLGLLHWRPSLAIHALPSTWNAISSYLFIPNLATSGDIRPVIPLGWTLSFEMAFYLLFAIGLAASGRVLRFITPAVLALALLGVFRTPAWPVWTAVADPIVLEFLAGVWIAHWTLTARLPHKAVAAALLAAGFLGLALLNPGSLAISRPVTWGICATMIVLATVALEPFFGSRLPQWLLALGDASYSIYLIQVFIFPLLHIGIAHWRPHLVHDHPLQAGVLMMAISLLTTSIAGLVLNRLVERPITAFLRTLAGASRPSPVTP